MGNPNLVRSMASCTVRLTAGGKKGPISVGTGFFYAMSVKKGAKIESPYSTFLVTNKHVLDGSEWVEFVVTSFPIGAAPGQFGVPQGAEHQNFRFLLGPGPLNHPSPDVDLCAVNVSELLNQHEAAKRHIDHAIMSVEALLAPNDRSHIRPVEPVVMIGYPSGLWDEVNNAAIVRRGITATHPFVRYAGRPEFLIDAACFPGSSGSPVFFFEDGMYRAGNEGFAPGTRIALLGILYAGPQYTAEGVLAPTPIPHGVKNVPVTNIPMNLGHVIHADELEVLADHYRSSIATA